MPYNRPVPGTVVPRDKEIAAAQLYYGVSDYYGKSADPTTGRFDASMRVPQRRGNPTFFYDEKYGAGVTGLYATGDHHLRAPPKHGSGPLDPARISVLRSADAAMPQSHLATMGQGHHLAKSSVKDERYMNLYSDLYGKPVDSDMHRHMTPTEMRYAQAQKSRTAMSLAKHVAVSPRSFI